DLARQRYDPPARPAAIAAAVALFVGLLGATSLFLWHAHTLDALQQAAGVGAIAAGLVLVGRLSGGTPARTARGTPAGASHRA
ncbi:MAG: hypothetical protein ACLGIT_05235, partial [Gammaproteobacteria bacterium]